jgi:phage terminase large subunit-like protein
VTTLAPSAPSSRVDTLAARCGLRLEPFQRRIARAVAGPEAEKLFLLARGQGKTTLMALDALAHFATVEDASVYVAASSEQQASLLFTAAMQFARALGDPHIVPRYNHLRWCPDPEQPKVWTRSLEVRAADWRKLHGLTYSRAYIDEMQVVDGRVYDAMASGLHKRPDAMLIIISTAGQGADSPLGKLRARALALPQVSRRGVVTDARGPDLRMLEWSLDQDADVDDPRVVKRANPASWITVGQLAEQRKRLPDLAYRRFIANQWTARAGHWLPPGAWQACVGTPEIADHEPIFVGVDIGGQRAATAVAWVTEDLRAGVWIGHGDDAVLEAADVIRGLAAKFTVREIVFDPWRAGQLAAELEREGLLVTAFPQSDSRMIPASARLHAAIVEKRITLPEHEELAQHAANTIAKSSRRGWRIDKPDDRTPNDAIVALCMAVDAAEQRPEPVELLGFI